MTGFNTKRMNCANRPITLQSMVVGRASKRTYQWYATNSKFKGTEFEHTFGITKAIWSPPNNPKSFYNPYYSDTMYNTSVFTGYWHGPESPYSAN